MGVAAMNKKAFVLGVDLDGTVADFYGGLRPIAAEWLAVPVETLPTEVSWNLPEWGLNKAPGGYDDLHKFAVTQRNLFRQLMPFAGAGIALRRLSKADIRLRIITHRLFIKYFHQVAIQQTVEWLDYHGIPYWDLCFMRDKGAVGADIYIEDSPENVAKLRADGHPTIVFANSTNRSLEDPRANDWEQVADMVMARLSDWKKKHEDEGQLAGQ
jgi:5'(3')-deoxyribonucleotidase